MDHHIAWKFDMRLPEQCPIVFSNAPSNGDQPEPRLEPALPYGCIPWVCGKLIEHGVDSCEQLSILIVSAGLELRQGLICKCVVGELSHACAGPIETDPPYWQ